MSAGTSTPLSSIHTAIKEAQTAMVIPQDQVFFSQMNGNIVLKSVLPDLGVTQNGTPITNPTSYRQVTFFSDLSQDDDAF